MDRRKAIKHIISIIGGVPIISKLGICGNKDDEPLICKQKFFRGQTVKIIRALPADMNHFEPGVRAIIEYSYSDRYGGNDTGSYSLLLLEPYPHSVAWYEENQLILINSDRGIGEKILQNYKENNLRRYIQYVYRMTAQ